MTYGLYQCLSKTPKKESWDRVSGRAPHSLCDGLIIAEHPPFVPVARCPWCGRPVRISSRRPVFTHDDLGVLRCIVRSYRGFRGSQPNAIMPVHKFHEWAGRAEGKGLMKRFHSLLPWNLKSRS